jgi:vacuolar-type H+-ATPase subunit H
MDDDILSKVVEVEKDVQQRIGIEKNMSREWLENVKRDAEEKILREEKELKTALDEAIRKTNISSEKKAIEIIKDANTEAEKLERLGNDILKKIIMKHTFMILPG